MYKILISVMCVLLITVILKNFKSSMSVPVVIAASVSLLLFSTTMLTAITDFIQTLTDKAGIDDTYIVIIFKCIGICLLGDFISGLCRDNGESALALNTEFVCKCSILVISLPVYADVFNMILKLWEN